MLRMEQMEAIKRMGRSESISTIASALNIDWKTAKKYAEMDDFNVTVVFGQYSLNIIIAMKRTKL